MIDTDWSPQTSPCCSGTPVITVALSRPQPDTTVCTVTGAVDWNTTPLVRDALTEARRDDNGHLVIDLSAVTLLDSTGLHAVLDALDFYDIDGHLAIVIDSRSDAITRPEISELSEIVDIHHDRASAMRARRGRWAPTGRCIPIAASPR